MKAVINKCYGGFGLSEKAIMMLANLKGLEVLPITNVYGSVEYWNNNVWGGKYKLSLTNKEYQKLSEEERIEYISFRNNNVFDYHKIPRHDEDLIKVVEMLGTDANCKYANLKIFEVEEHYTIDERDGNEFIKY